MSSKLMPVFLTLVRGLLWRNGMLDDFFREIAVAPHNDDPVEYGKLPPYYYDYRVDNKAVSAFADTILSMGSAEDVFGSFSELEYANLDLHGGGEGLDVGGEVEM